MLKFVKGMLFVCCIVLLFYFVGIVADQQTIKNNVIRFHVLANSNDCIDQQVKLQVRDAILEYLNEIQLHCKDQSAAKKYLENHISDISEVANNKLKELGSKQCAKVSLTREGFDVRRYDTFTLPSGVYDSLRVEIGAAEGENWWCVIFPALCLPSTVDAFKDSAISYGMDKSTVNAISNNSGYEVRFFFLDCLGKIENLFYFG